MQFLLSNISSFLERFFPSPLEGSKNRGGARENVKEGEKKYRKCDLN
jgi:hypothetical protein